MSFSFYIPHKKRKVIDYQKFLQKLTEKEFLVPYNEKITVVTIESICINILDCITESNFYLLRSKKEIKKILDQLKKLALEGI